MNYTPTHQSRFDQSPAMLVSETMTTITLVNEDGFEWTDFTDRWELIGSEVDQSVAYDAEADSVAYPPSPYDDEWENGYMPGSGENMYDDSYIDYLNRN